MGVIITLDTIMRCGCIMCCFFSWVWIALISVVVFTICLLILFPFVLKNVDSGGAKELMAYLVKLQSNLTEVNK